MLDMPQAPELTLHPARSPLHVEAALPFVPDATVVGAPILRTSIVLRKEVPGTLAQGPLGPPVECPALGDRRRERLIVPAQLRPPACRDGTACLLISRWHSLLDRLHFT